MRRRSSAKKADLPSRHVTEGMHTALNRIYFHAMGLERADIDGPIVGVASAWSSGSAVADLPLRVARAVEQGIWAGGATPREFATIAGADDDSRAPGAPSLLMTRELVADSVELTVRGHSYDALVGITGCPLAMAGLMLAMARLDIPSVLVPLAGPGTDEEAHALAVAAQAVGLASPGAGAATISERRALESGRQAGELVVARLEKGSTPRRTISRASLRDAATLLGETSAAPGVAIHLAALARECGIDMTLRDLARALEAAGGGRVRWLEGTLAPEGALMSGAPAAPASGSARVFDAEAAACAWVRRGDWGEGTVPIVRAQGPRGYPGMPSLTDLAAAIAESGHPRDAVLVTDGRLPRIDGLTCVSAVSPEAAAGGPIAFIADGDPIELDPAAGAIGVAVAPAVLASRPDGSWSERRFTSAAQAKYARVVMPARLGAPTHPGAAGEQKRYAEI